jgi:DNA-binding NtrC family response regulator
MATILLVDNDPLQAFLYKAILEVRFPDVQRVAYAAEAFCLVEQPQFASNLGLVISGHHMPGLDGPAFVAELHSRLPWVPILVLGDADEAAEDYAGCDACFRPRPVSREELLKLTEQMLAQSKLNMA